MRYEEDYAKCNPGWGAEDAPDKVREVLRAISRANLRPTSACDIGCGVGDVLAQLYRCLKLECAVGSDISRHAIAQARQREAEGLEFRLGDATLDRESFDVMLILDVVEHVGGPVAFLRAIKHKAPIAILNPPAGAERAEGHEPDEPDARAAGVWPRQLLQRASGAGSHG
jgi:SAM-dependent methyltransferase